MSKGFLGTRPAVDSTHLLDVVDRFLADCLLNALYVSNTQSVFIFENEAASQEDQRLRKKVVAPFSNVPRSRFFPVREVFKSRLTLFEQNGSGSRNVCNKTIESRLGLVLSSKNVHLYSLSRKLRCYALDSALPDTVQSVIYLSSGDDVSILPKDRRVKFNEVCRQFVDDKDIYRSGKWFLPEQITAIPKQLWASVFLVMASNKQLASCKVAAYESGKTISELFPVCNDRERLPICDLDNFAHRSLHRSEYLQCIPRCDFVLCLRALELIEQIAFSRSRRAIGPLQMTLSIAGILETAASWTSVLHALVVVTSYDSTEKLRKRLVAEREQSCKGAFENVKLENRLTTVQMDNFHIHPLHSVKASGKTLPIVSGTVTQGVVQSIKRIGVWQDTPPSTSRDPVALDAWLDPKTVLKSRTEFASSFYSDDYKSILDEFFDVVFGVAYESRAVLLGE